MTPERTSDDVRVEEREDGFVVEVQLAPRASRNALLGVHDGRLKIALTAPPVDGAANDALVGFLADALHVPRSGVRIVRGQRARRKVVFVSGSSALLWQLLASRDA